MHIQAEAGLERERAPRSEPATGAASPDVWSGLDAGAGLTLRQRIEAGAFRQTITDIETVDRDGRNVAATDVAQALLRQRARRAGGAR